MSDQQKKTYIIRKIESYGIYDGTDKDYYGLPFVKLAVANEKIEGDVGAKYPELNFEETYVLNDEEGKAIRTASIKVNLTDAEMYKHGHTKNGRDLIYIYTFVYKSMSISSTILE